LDFVLLKALRKEPHERYVSVDAFADDIRAFLEWRPVQARSGNAWYRARKFTRRYWLFVIAASLTIAGLSVGLFAANRERAIAQRRFQQVRQLANKLFVLDIDLRDVPGSTKARLALTGTSKEYLEALAAEARGDNALAFEIGVAYLSLARIQGVPTHSNLGMLPDAEESLRRADSFIEPLLALSPSDQKLLIYSAQIAHDRMILAESSRRGSEALQHGKKAAARYEALLPHGTLSETENVAAANAFSNIAQTHMNLHRYDEANTYVNRAITLARSLKTEIPLVSTLSLKANILRQTGHLEGALQAIEESRQVMERIPEKGTRVSALLRYSVLWREGMILGVDEGISLNRPADAIDRFQRAFDAVMELTVIDPNDSSGRSRAGTAGRELCRVMRHSDPQRAVSMCDETIRLLREIPNNIKARRDEAALLAASSYSLRRLNRFPEAEKRIQMAFDVLRQTKDYPASRIDPGEEAYFTVKALADHQADLGQTAKAIETYKQLLEKLLAAKPDPLHDLRHATDFSRIYKAFAQLARQGHQAQLAQDLDAKRADLWRHWDTNLPNNSYIKRQME
jgi:tetratricopeptide (TPR) repeat protein